jgi:hypothetical protein
MSQTEFHFVYDSSLKSFNKKEEKNLAYVCRVDDRNLNLTPLGKFVMPPPMFEKQVTLDGFPVHLDMFGHQVVAMTESGEIALFDCMDHEKVSKFKLEYEGKSISPFEVTKLVAYRLFPDDSLKLVIVHISA